MLAMGDQQLSGRPPPVHKGFPTPQLTSQHNKPSNRTLKYALALFVEALEISRVMELPVFGCEGPSVIPDHGEQSEHGPPSEDDLANVLHYNIALPVTDVTGAFGALGRVEYATNGAATDTDQYNRNTINQLSFVGQDFAPQTWLPISQTIAEQIFDFNDLFANANANLVVPVSGGNNTDLVGSPADQSAIWGVALEPQMADPINLFVGPQPNMDGFYFDDLNIDHVNSGAPFQTLSCSNDSHTNNSPAQLPIQVHSALVLKKFKAKMKKRQPKKQSTARLGNLPCATCRSLKQKCDGPTHCSRCKTKGIPSELCVRFRLRDVLTFDKYLSDGYKNKVVYLPCGKAEEYSTVTLLHDPNGHPVEVKCYQFVKDSKTPHQTRTFWQGPNGYEKIETTTWSLNKDFLDVDLEPYVVYNIPVFVQKACDGPRETAVIFQQACKLIDRPVIFLGLKIYVALTMLMKGWSISGNEHLGMSTLHAGGAPCDGEIPVPAVMERQLDHKLEALLAKWEHDICKEWESLATKRRDSWRTELWLATFLILHVLERDALRLKIRFGSQEAMNDWKHPLPPLTLVQKTIHFCNTLLANFRALQSKNPLALDCSDDDLMSYVGKDPTAFDVMRTLQRHKGYLDSNSFFGRKICAIYKPGDNRSGDFTWSSDESLARDYLRRLLETSNPTLANEFNDLWTEYKDGKSEVAKRVRDACACAYALQDGNSNGTARTGKQISELRKLVQSQDLKGFMGILEDEIKAPDQTEYAKLMKAIKVGKDYWGDPSESKELVFKAIKTISLTTLLTFLRLTQLLGKVDRAGWVIRGVSSEKAEKVPGHEWRMGILAWLVVPQQGKINRQEVINMNCAHDMAEFLITDITPSDGISDYDKETHERCGQDLLVYTLQTANPFAARFLQRLFTTFEFRCDSCPEAQASHDTDEVECRFQAVEYAGRYKKVETIEDDFLKTKPKMYLQEFREIAELLSQELATSLSRRKDIRIVFVLGGPAVGKGTQCKLLAEKYNYVHHISVGELLDQPSPFTDFITESKKKYVIIPAQLTVSLLQDEMSRGLSDGKRLFVVDGFPRSVDQANYFDEIISDSYSTILLDCDERIMTERSNARAKAAREAGKERVDDNPETIAKRVDGFRKKNKSVENHLKRGGRFEIV
ncbi:hypothetical protein VE03_10113 [Pseudogymnoascus sp. 23342-1-I1]|nr:hypothetical protein VE03_10113 [Pseudogymnoascus sp. 23342-1-I1]